MNYISLSVKLMLAVFLGGLIGIERTGKRRPAGFRTYMFVCVGATLAMLLSQYEIQMLQTVWSNMVNIAETKMDVSRYGAQVINGVGFIGAGTIIATRRQEVKGLTTAAGLWVSACMGLAIGVGFYECIIFAFILVWLSIKGTLFIESRIIENSKNMNLYIEFESLNDISSIITCIKTLDIKIYSVDIDRGEEKKMKSPCAVFDIRLEKKMSHAGIIRMISNLHRVSTVYEL